MDERIGKPALRLGRPLFIPPTTSQRQQSDTGQNQVCRVRETHHPLQILVRFTHSLQRFTTSQSFRSKFLLISLLPDSIVICNGDSELKRLGRYWSRATPRAKRAGTSECGSSW
jgi:hypothetical protein